MKNLSVIGILFLVFFSCRQDIDETGLEIVTQEPPIIIDDYNPDSEIINGTIFGRVYDENENPVPDATVKYDGKTFTTDEDGRFFITDESLDKEGTFFTVEADGYFKGSRTLYPQDGSVNYAYVQLLALDEIGSFNASDGGQIDGQDGIGITFSPNSIQSANGSLYSGQVFVAAKWLDPTADNIGEIMPGSLVGLNAQVEEVALVSYGMMAVELYGENGEKLNIASGNTATLSFPVPQELLNNAPQTIPLWSFEDEQYGIWAEEGSAILQNGKYIGDVSHFSFWNCDAPFPLVYIEGQVVTQDGTPLANTIITVFPDGSNSGRFGNTDNEGFFAGKMPKDVELILQVGYRGEDCDFSPINLGSFNEDTNIGQIVVEESGASFTITGNIVDCNDNAIDNGLIIVKIGTTRTELFIDEENEFNVALLNCDNSDEVSVTGVDVENLVEGNVVSRPIEPTVDFGTIKACGSELSEFFTLTINGKTATVAEDLSARCNSYGGSLTFDIGRNLDSLGIMQAFSLRLIIPSVVTIGTYSSSDIVFIDLNLTTPTFEEDIRMFCEADPILQ